MLIAADLLRAGYRLAYSARAAVWHSHNHTLKQEYERHLLLQLFDFSDLTALQESMVRLFADHFYHSQASLKQLHDQTLQDLSLRVTAVSDKWRQQIAALPFEGLRQPDFLERVRRSASYFADTLNGILAKPLALTAKVETNNKQATRRLANLLPDERQTWLSRRYLLTKMAEQGYTVSTYLREKQMSMLDALDADAPRRNGRNASAKGKKKTKESQVPKEPKPKTWEVSLALYRQGMKFEEIARERSLTQGTVMNHLARYLATGEVAIDDLVPPDHQRDIAAVIQRIGTAEGTTAIKELCPPDITYDEITAGLLVREVRRKRQDLFEALGLYYRIYVLHENPADILDED
jgi:hypothetical protein